MLSIENLEEFTKKYQTTDDNIVREYFQHLFLSYLYRLRGSDRLLFKGGTALRIVYHSPRFSEDLDFTGINITQAEVEDLFTAVLADIEKTAIDVELKEGKPTSGGYLGIAIFHAYDMLTPIQIEVSLRRGKPLAGTRTQVQNDYLPAYTLVHVPTEDLIKGKLAALFNRHKPRDFYDYFFLLSGNYPLAKDKDCLSRVLELIQSSKIDFRLEIKKFLPASHSMHLRNFKKILADKIKTYIG